MKLNVVFWTSNNIRNAFRFKDQIPISMNSSVIYKYKCNICNDVYNSKRRYEINQNHFVILNWNSHLTSLKNLYRYIYLKTIRSLLLCILVAMVKQYARKQFISNYHELCNFVVFIIAWKREQWFTKDLANNMLVLFSLFEIYRSFYV